MKHVSSKELCPIKLGVSFLFGTNPQNKFETRPMRNIIFNQDFKREWLTWLYDCILFLVARDTQLLQHFIFKLLLKWYTKSDACT